MPVSADCFAESGIVVGRIVRDDVEAGNSVSFKTIKEPRIMNPSQGPAAETIQGPFIDGDDDNPSVRFHGAAQTEKETIAIVAHPVEKSQIFDRHYQGKSDKDDNKIF
jgi:hypothetical protein